MREPDRTLAFALERYPEQVEAVPIKELLLDAARRNERRPAWVKLAVPDEVVKAVRGRAEDGDLVLLVRVPREVAARQESRIILPGESR